MNRRCLKNDVMRGLAVAAGIFMVGIAVGFLKSIELGADPFTAMNSGISAWLNIQFGTLQLMVSVAFLAFVFVFKRQFIGFGTIFNMVFVGYTADFVIWLLKQCQVSFDTWEMKIVFLVLAVIVVCIGDALYISADLGMAPYDAAGYIIQMLTKGKIQFRVARILLDAGCVAIALTTGMCTGVQWKIIGVGTVILMLCTGPLIQFFRVHWSDKLLSRFKETGGEKAGAAVR